MENNKKHILIVDDDDRIRDLLKDYLSENNYIVSTAENADQAKERIEGLEVGADDYLPKPFEPKELILRIKNIINKTKKKDQKRIIEFENIKIDLNKQIIFKEKFIF